MVAMGGLLIPSSVRLPKIDSKGDSSISDDGKVDLDSEMEDRKVRKLDLAERKIRFSQLARLNCKVVGLHDDLKSHIRAGHNTVQIRKTIYSAAALDPTHWPTAILTFALQIMILVLYMHEPHHFLDVKLSPLVDEKLIAMHVVLGRFISYFVVWVNAVDDLQNGVNLFLCTSGYMRILGFFHLFLVTMYPIVWVSTIRRTKTFTEALTQTGIMALFMQLDEHISSVMDLGIMKREVGEIVHTINNPLKPGLRETIMISILMVYTLVTFFYVWFTVLDTYLFPAIVWIVFALCIFRTFYLDMYDAKEMMGISPTIVKKVFVKGR